MMNAVRALKIIAVLGISVVSLGLAMLNVWGAWNASGESQFYTLAIGGAEIYVAVVFPLLLLAPGYARKIIGSIVFIALVYVCVENGKVGVKTALADVFTESSDVLRQQAQLKREEVAAAQRLAVEYRRQSADQQKATIDLYKNKVVTAAQPISDKADALDEKAIEQDNKAFAAQQEIIRLNATAEKIESRTWWLYILLVGLEGARSFGLWAFVLWDRKSKDKDTVTINGKEYEKDWLAKATEHRETFEEGLRKSAETREKNNRKRNLSGYIDNEPFIEQFVEEIESMRAQGLSISEMAAKRGQTSSELIGYLKFCYSSDEIKDMRKGKKDEGDDDSQDTGEDVRRPAA